MAAAVTICGTAVAVVVARRADDRKDATRFIEALSLQTGSTVAEIGAGGGEISVLIARHVGSTGRVFTTELGEDRVTKLRQAVERAEAANVTVLDAHATRANLPEQCCDAIFMRSVYHHFEDPATMNRSLWEALRPGGRLAVMDFAPRGGSEAAAPADRDESGHHGVTAETVLSELTRAGFERVQFESSGARDFLVVVRKPAS
ncbi:MAG: class I SAM-dependent methyltransferase [Vicinamibacterales bacterium]